MGIRHISELDSIDVLTDVESSSSNEERVGKRISQVSFVDNNSKNPRIEVSKMNDVDSDVENKERRNESNHSFVLTQSVV